MCVSVCVGTLGVRRNRAVIRVLEHAFRTGGGGGGGGGGALVLVPELR